MLARKLPCHLFFNWCSDSYIRGYSGYHSATYYLNSHINSFLSNQTPATLQQLLQSHALIITTGNAGNVFVSSKLIAFYAAFNQTRCSRQIFELVDEKDTFLWNSIIHSHFSNGNYAVAFDFYIRMRLHNASPSQFTIPMVVSSCAELQWLKEAKTAHGLVVKSGLFMENSAVWSSFVYMYAKCGVMNDASLMGATATFCRSLHCYTMKNFMEDNNSVVNSLIDMYGKSGKLTIAERIFRGSHRDVVSWNTMIAVYCHGKCFVEAIALFEEMVQQNVNPNSATFATVLSACSHLADLQKGEKVHRLIRTDEQNVSLATALVDMYAKCGRLDKSREIFNSMKVKDSISWNVMISGYAMHGDAISAIEIFEEMEEQTNIKPNSLTFLSLLSACAHSGLVEEGKRLFGKMKQHSVRPNLKHYACLVDVLGRSGSLLEAEELVLSMPICPDGGIWGALLGACKIHDDFITGIRIAKQAIKTDPKNDGYYIVLSDMYSSIGKWKESERAREMMKEQGIEKTTGWSFV
ncbi:unnamed protein product [Linum tenue]|uniref:Pentatricopeptide repeat-containing protein n=1 Tax=Linum tenue TaxID=586396 RepID=A0AAV0GVR3_9ROSI|nr:unnamed protein product [Linum tenue]